MEMLPQTKERILGCNLVCAYLEESPIDFKRAYVWVDMNRIGLLLGQINENLTTDQQCLRDGIYYLEAANETYS